MVAPVGVFALSLSLAMKSGGQLGPALAQFVVGACGLLAIGTLGLYAMAVFMGGVPLVRFARACAHVQAVAMSTRSSLASLPAMLDAADRKLQLPPEITGLLLPLAVSLFRFASPILLTTGSLFIARLYAIHLPPATVAAMALALAALSFAVPGIPSGGLLVAGPVFTAFGLPMEGLALLLAVNVIPDMFATVTNVTADMTVATILSRRLHATAPSSISALTNRPDCGGRAPALPVP